MTNSDPMTSKQFNKLQMQCLTTQERVGVQGYLCRVMKRVGVLLHLFKRDRVLLNGEIFSTGLYVDWGSSRLFSSANSHLPSAM